MRITKKTIFSLIAFSILVIGIPISTYLIKQQQILKSKASLDASRIEFVDNQDNPISQTATTSAKIKLTYVPPDGTPSAVISSPSPTLIDDSTPLAEKDWTIMAYLDGDNSLESSIIADFNKLEQVGSNSSVNILAQIDRGSSKGNDPLPDDKTNKDWTGARRYYIEKDDNLENINSKKVADLGDINTASPDTLFDFMKWAAEKYPAKNTILILSDHGGGWTSLLQDLSSNKSMNLNELALALKKYKDLTKKNLNIIDFDMCLMAQLEVYSTISDYADLAIGSAEYEPALGQDYKTFVETITSNPQINTEDLAKKTVENFKLYYQGNPSERIITLSATRLNKIPKLIEEFTNFSNLLSEDIENSWKSLVKSAVLAQRFGANNPEIGSVDLQDLIDLYTSQPNLKPPVKEAILKVKSTLKDSIISSVSGNDIAVSGGLAVYLPWQEDYDPKYGSEVQSAQKTNWHQTLEKIFQAQKDYNTPKPVLEILTAPQATSAGEILNIDYKLTGQDLLDLRMYTVWVENNNPFILDESFIREQDDNGLALPNFKDGENNESLEWVAESPVLTNGEKSTLATMHPYNRARGKSVLYYTDGLYRTQEGEISATLIFDYTDGQLVNLILHYENEDGNDLPVSEKPDPQAEFIPYFDKLNLENGSIEQYLDENLAIQFKDGLTITTEPLFSGQFFIFLQGEDITGKIGIDALAIDVNGQPAQEVQGISKVYAQTNTFPTSYRIANSQDELVTAKEQDFNSNGKIISWQLQPGLGQKTVYAQFKLNGVWGQVISANIDLISPSASPFQVKTNKYDLNGDGKINSFDISIFFGKFMSRDSNKFPEVDYNNDGVINTFDYALLIKNFNL